MTPRRLTIVEGPDGAGKTTLARRLAEATGAAYAHLGPEPLVTTGLPRLYVEVALPALLGYQDVILDRSWLSEPIYGSVHRGGLDRVGPVYARMLERLLLRCAVGVVRCDPGWDAVHASWASRRAAELLADPAQLRRVHELYAQLRTALPLLSYDYREEPAEQLSGRLEGSRSQPHPAGAGTAGSLGAEILLVGEGCGPRKNDDPLLRWPFGSFSQAGCSAWLTEQLEAAGVGEELLLWANAADAETALRTGEQLRHVIALGQEALTAVASPAAARGLAVHQVPHPQFHKRFHAREPYPLPNLLKEITDGDAQPGPRVAADA